MAIRTELSLRIPNSPGALATVCSLLSNERVNVAAMALESGGQLRLVVDNHVHGAAVLREHHHQVTERDVLVTVVPNTPGALAPLLRLVAESAINLEYAYGAGADPGNAATVVFGVADAMKASAATGI